MIAEDIAHIKQRAIQKRDKFLSRNPGEQVPPDYGMDILSLIHERDQLMGRLLAYLAGDTTKQGFISDLQDLGIEI